MAHAEEEGVFRSEKKEVRFGPVEKSTRYFVLDRDGTPAFGITRQFVQSVEATLAKYPSDRYADVLAVFAVRHAFTDRSNGVFQPFAALPASLLGQWLESIGAVTPTGEYSGKGAPGLHGPCPRR